MNKPKTSHKVLKELLRPPKKNDWKTEWRLDRKNKPFQDDSVINKISESKKQEESFEVQRDLILALDKEWWQNPQTAQDIFYLLTGITYRKNQSNNKYLHEFQNWLDEHIKNGKDKEEIWKDLQRVYDKFTVHGQKNNTWLLRRADIDASASILLLEIAWFTPDWYKNLTFVENEQSWPGINLDTWIAWWIKIEWYEKSHTTIKDGKIRREKSLFGTKLLLDEHWGGPCSTTRMVYQILKTFNKIPYYRKDQIKRFVEFVDVVDDLWYQACGLTSSYLERTIFWLYKALPTWFVFNYFKDANKTWFEYLDDKYLNENKVSIFDVWSKQKEEKTLKEISDEKKKRIQKSNREFLKAESNWYFLMLWDTRFIVDLWWRLTDWPEMASMWNKWIIRLFPWTWDLYIYSPSKLSGKIWWFDINNDHFIIDKIWSGKDINKLLNEFKYLKDREFEESKDPWSKRNLKKEIVDYRQNIEDEKVRVEKEKEISRQQKIETTELWLKNILSDLPEISIDSLEIGKDYDGVVNNIRGNIVFVTFDKDNKVRWVLHKNDVESIDLFKSIMVWDKLYVKIKEKEDNWENIKIRLVLNNIVQENKKDIKVA